MNLEKIKAHVALNEELEYLLSIIDQLSEIPEEISEAREPEWDPTTADAIIEYVRSYIADAILDA